MNTATKCLAVALLALAIFHRLLVSSSWQLALEGLSTMQSKAYMYSKTASPFQNGSILNDSLSFSSLPPLSSSSSSSFSSDIDDDAEEPNRGKEKEETEEIKVKVSFPVLVASLFKSGTTTSHDYFKCGGQKSVHKFFNGRKRTSSSCILANFKQGKPLFQGCGDFDIYADNGYVMGRNCFDPSVQALEAFYSAYPNATILLTVRDSHSWIDSVERFRFPRFNLLNTLKGCKAPPWPNEKDLGRNVTKEDIRLFYEWQVNHVRQFAREHPSITYIEVSLESNQTGAILEEKIGIPAKCWGHSNINKRIPSSKRENTTTASTS